MMRMSIQERQYISLAIVSCNQEVDLDEEDEDENPVPITHAPLPSKPGINNHLQKLRKNMGGANVIPNKKAHMNERSTYKRYLNIQETAIWN